MNIDKRELYTLMDIVEKLKAARSDSDILTSFLPLNKIIPFNAIIACRFNYIDEMPIVERLVNRGFEQNFLTEYGEKNMLLEDHVLNFCMQNVLPCIWTQVGEKIGGENRSLMLCELTRKYGYIDGVSYAVKEHEFGKVTYLTMTIDPNLKINNKLALISTITPFIHLAFDSCAIKHNIFKPDFGLTSREKEVFKWIAEGKTQWEVSKILAVSERTIRFHITNVTRKLNATNSTHAVAKLIGYKMLH